MYYMHTECTHRMYCSCYIWRVQPSPSAPYYATLIHKKKIMLCLRLPLFMYQINGLKGMMQKEKWRATGVWGNGDNGPETKAAEKRVGISGVRWREEEPCGGMEWYRKRTSTQRMPANGWHLPGGPCSLCRRQIGETQITDKSKVK